MTKHGAAAALLAASSRLPARRRRAGGGAARRAAGDGRRAPGDRARRSRRRRARCCGRALEEDVDPRALEAAVRGGTGPRAHPLVAAQAAWLLARLTSSGARRARRRRCGRRWACSRTVSVIGPFGQGRASFGTTFPPEEEPAPPETGAQLSGQGARCRLALGRRGVRDGVLYLDGSHPAGAERVAYVAAAVHSDRDRAVALRLGSPGPIKVWINGAARLPARRGSCRRRSIRTRSACASAAAGTGSSSRP